MKTTVTLPTLALASTLSLSARAFDADMAARVAPVAGQLTH